MSRKVRVRFAPSPTGPLHPGGVRTALFNYLFAKQHGGDFILRIEDTDQNRFVEGAEQFIINSLAWCGIAFDEGVHIPGGKYAPYRQSERKPMYREFAMRLVETGNAYYAFDTTEELDAMREIHKKAYNTVTRFNMKNSLTLPQDEVQNKLDNNEPYVIRFKMPRNEDVKVFDLIRNWVTFNSTELDDKVLFKSDGMPTYHLANVVDDYLMQITHVIRGEEWLPSLPLHVLLYKAFGWEDAMPHFAHLPLLLKPDGNGKLSKRDGDKLGMPFYAIEWNNPETNEKTLGYKENGFLPEAYINFLVLLGWNPGENKELMTVEEMIDLFSIERISKSGARYDFDKLKWFNQTYLRQMPEKEIAKIIQPKLKQIGYDFNTPYVVEMCRLMKERCVVLNDFIDRSMYFFEAPKVFDTVVISKKWIGKNPQIMAQTCEKYQSLKSFSAQDSEDALQAVCDQNEVSKGSVLQALRVAVTGEGAGPSLFETLELLGQAEVVKRLSAAILVLNKQNNA